MLFPLLIWLLASIHLPEKNESTPLTSDEQKLALAINSYRKTLGLKSVPISNALTKVAQLHAADLKAFPPKEPCNMHSWSANGKWTPCCYTPDHKQAQCMWLKPSELTDYAGNGYEISAFNTAPQVDWLAQWKKSIGHNQVITNQSIWKEVEWKAMGLAIRPPYAVVWFGKEEDKTGAKE